MKDLLQHHPLLSVLKCVVVVLLGLVRLQAQEASTTEDSTFYREDQIYFGASFMILESNQERFKPQGLSRHIQLGFVRDFPLSKSGRVATGVGLGMGFERYTTNLIPSGIGFYTLPELNTDPTDPLFISVQSLELPLTLRWRSSSPSDFAFWRVYGGVTLQWNYRIRAKQNSEAVPLSDEIDTLGATANLSFGFNTWNFYVAYRLSPFFDSKGGSLPALPIQITPLKIGLIFYLL